MLSPPPPFHKMFYDPGRYFSDVNIMNTWVVYS